MSTMTHTPEQRKAWHAGKSTGKQRRRMESIQGRLALRENRKLVKWLKANLTDAGKAAYASKIRTLGGAAADVWLVRQAGH